MYYLYLHREKNKYDTLIMSDTASKDSVRQYGSSLPDLSKLTLGPGETSEDKLSHLLPNEYGSLSQPLTNGETLGLN